MAEICKGEDNEIIKILLLFLTDKEETENPYDRWKKDSGKLHIRLFDSVKEFRKALLEYTLQVARRMEYSVH